MDPVVIIRWPDDEGRRAEAARAGRARLLVLEGDVPPPVTSDPLEDWVRAGAPLADRDARAAALRLRIRDQRAVLPELDDDGVIRFGERWAPLPPLEARLVRTMVSRFGKVVSRRELTKAGWPGENPGRNALDVHVLRLRRRLEPVELVIKTVRARGYVLDRAQPG